MMPVLQTHGLSKYGLLLTNCIVLICRFKKLKCPEQIKSLSWISSPYLLPRTIWCPAPRVLLHGAAFSEFSETPAALLHQTTIWFANPLPSKPGLLTQSSLTISNSDFKRLELSPCITFSTHILINQGESIAQTVSLTERSWANFPLHSKQASGQGIFSSKENTSHLSVTLCPMWNFHLTFSSQKCKVRKQNLCII